MCACKSAEGFLATTAVKLLILTLSSDVWNTQVTAEGSGYFFSSFFIVHPMWEGHQLRWIRKEISHYPNWASICHPLFCRMFMWYTHVLLWFLVPMNHFFALHHNLAFWDPTVMVMVTGFWVYPLDWAKVLDGIQYSVDHDQVSTIASRHHSFTHTTSPIL